MRFPFLEISFSERDFRFFLKSRQHTIHNNKKYLEPLLVVESVVCYDLKSCVVCRVSVRVCRVCHMNERVSEFQLVTVSSSQNCGMPRSSHYIDVHCSRISSERGSMFSWVQSLALVPFPGFPTLTRFGSRMYSWGLHLLYALANSNTYTQGGLT